MVTDLRKDRFFHQSRHCANVCIFLFEMSLSMFFIFRQRSSSYTIVAVGFCKACLFFFFSSIFCIFSCITSSTFLPSVSSRPEIINVCTKLGNYRLLNYSLPSFFCFSPVLHCAFLCVFLFPFFNVYQNC